MHVLYLNYHLDHDLRSADQLLERYYTMTKWCIALKRTGMESVSIVQAWHADQYFRRAGVDCHFVRPGPLPFVPAWLSPGRIHAKVRELAPDVVHHSGHVYPLSFLRAELGAKTTLLWQHRGGETTRFPGMLLKRRGFNAVDGFLFSAKELATSSIPSGMIKEHQRIYEIMGGSARGTPLEQKQAKKEIGLSASPIFLWVGRLNANKDPLTVLKGFARTIKTRPEAHLYMIYHDSPLLSPVRSLISDFHLESNVHLLGRIESSEMVRYYSAADYFILGSHREGTGFAVLEALACGVTPIITDIPPFRRLTHGGTVGALWEPGDDSALSSAIERTLLAKPSRSLVRKYFLRQWSFDALAQQAVRLYDDVYRHRNSLLIRRVS